MATIENIKRVLRQLEATGENLEHSSIKSTIENKFTIIGFGQGICSKRVEVPWSRHFLESNIIHVTQKVKNCQNPSTFTDTKFTFNKLRQKPRYNPGRISALSMMSSNPKFSSTAIQSDQYSSQFTITKRRLRIFCTQDHWNSECDVYITANDRHNTALCETEIQLHQTAWLIPKSGMITKIFEFLIKRIVQPLSISQATPFEQNIQPLTFGHMLIQSKVGPMIAGYGDVKLENFWRLESIRIQESPNDNDDEGTPKRFLRTVEKKRASIMSAGHGEIPKPKLSNNYGL
ncbi:hypothetical protein DINM_000060 [Dirofilaria immitis]|nr:hypothetical protein [Dirofilaria immitis]